MSPQHLFVDLQIVERLLPLIDLLSGSDTAGRGDEHKRTRNSSIATDTHALSPRPATPIAPHQILDELDCEPCQDTPDLRALRVSCPMLRMSVRCPPPTSRTQSFGNNAKAVRSAIIVLDLQQINLHAPEYRSVPEEVLRLNWNRAHLAMLPPDCKFLCLLSSRSACGHSC